MFALILIFYGGASDSVPGLSAHALLYPTEAACLAQANNYVSYQQGIEAGKGAAASQVVGYCRPVKVVNASPTT